MKIIVKKGEKEVSIVNKYYDNAINNIAPGTFVVLIITSIFLVISIKGLIEQVPNMWILFIVSMIGLLIGISLVITTIRYTIQGAKNIMFDLERKIVLHNTSEIKLTSEVGYRKDVFKTARTSTSPDIEAYIFNFSDSNHNSFEVIYDSDSFIEFKEFIDKNSDIKLNKI